jgi:hypothetical protein
MFSAPQPLMGPLVNARQLERSDGNRHSMAAAHPRGAFGGVKQSGYGRELGRFGIDGYTEIQQIVDPPAA